MLPSDGASLHQVVIRESAAEALRACLQLILQRDSSNRPQWYAKTYEEVQRGAAQSPTFVAAPSQRRCSRAVVTRDLLHLAGFKLATTESIHGSLLCVRELLSFTGTVRAAPSPASRVPGGYGWWLVADDADGCAFCRAPHRRRTSLCKVGTTRRATR